LIGVIPGERFMILKRSISLEFIFQILILGIEEVEIAAQIS
jgi:hypothetical protein